MSQNFRPKKSLGQHFLKDEKVVNKIVQALELNKNDQVLEIGPGMGVLTEKILPKVNKLIAIEKDDQLVRFLGKRFGDQENLELIAGDFLDLVGNKNFCSLRNVDNLKIVGNLPYNQSKPILRKILESPRHKGGVPRLHGVAIVVMLQKEVADKILDNEKGSILGLSVQLFATVESVMIVSSKAFKPKPKVDSQIIKLILRNKPLIVEKDQASFFEMIKKAFRHPRKKLLNNLPEISESDLEQIDILPNSRPENVKLEQWVKLFQQTF